MLSAVTYMHGQGICNRDFKLENMLVSEDLAIKVADFGFAVRVEGPDGGGAHTTSLGTPGYMAPELLEGRAYSGAAADLYALGVVLFAMVTVNMPFSALRYG